MTQRGGGRRKSCLPRSRCEFHRLPLYLPVADGPPPSLAREDEMRRRGLDPSLSRRDDESGTAPDQQVGPASGQEEGRLTDVGATSSLGVAQPHPRDQTVPQSCGGARHLAPASDEDLPPSTPAPPSLNVPIVTRSRPSTEGKLKADGLSPVVWSSQLLRPCLLQ